MFAEVYCDQGLSPMKAKGDPGWLLEFLRRVASIPLLD
jgi:hypothetical protein